MYAFGPNGLPIVSAKQIVPASAAIMENSAGRDGDGKLVFSLDSTGTVPDWDGESGELARNGEAVLIDGGGLEWSGDQVILSAEQTIAVLGSRYDQIVLSEAEASGLAACLIVANPPPDGYAIGTTVYRRVIHALSGVAMRENVGPIPAPPPDGQRRYHVELPYDEMAAVVALLQGRTITTKEALLTLALIGQQLDMQDFAPG